MKYILIILAKSDKQSELVQSIATELGGICPRSDVRYFYTEESIFFSFSTDYNLNDMQNFVFELFDEMELIYFLSQYNPDKMFTNMSEKTSTYLFNESTLFQKFVSVENNMDKLDEIDNEILEKAARETGYIVTAEEHNIIGGMGSAVTESVSESYPVPIKRIGAQDMFGESARDDEIHLLLEKHGITSFNMAKQVKEIRSKKL